jgi:hypothetical protein
MVRAAAQFLEHLATSRDSNGPDTRKQRSTSAMFQHLSPKSLEPLLPVYSIKERKKGPLDYYAYIHDKRYAQVAADGGAVSLAWRCCLRFFLP